MKNENKIKIISVAAAGAAFAFFGLDNKLTLANYTLRSEKIKRPVNIVFLSDIHSQKFKDGGEELLDFISSANADFVLFGGDIFDKYSTEKELDMTFNLIDKIKEKNENCYFVLGNHEVDCKRKKDLDTALSEKGINIVNGKSFELTAANGQKILLGGTDYMRCENKIPEDEAAFEAKKDFISYAKKTGLFSIMLRHVPFKTKGDEKIDLILSGHNHGGLWRFPKTNAGVAGGGSTLFPKYVHGKYKNGDSVMIVGSGITTKTYFIPRLYNTPEVVCVTLLPKIQLPV